MANNSPSIPRDANQDLVSYAECKNYRGFPERVAILLASSSYAVSSIDVEMPDLQ